MPAYRLSMVFRATTGTAQFSPGQRGAGWTESVIWDNIDASTRTSFNRLCNKRAALLPASARIVGQRFQQIDPSGRAQTARTNFPGSGAVEASRGQPTDAVRVSYRGSGVNNVGKRSIACIPDTMLSDGEYNPTPVYQISMAAFLAELNGWKFRGADLTVAKVQVKTVSDLGVVEVNTDLPVVTGDRVRLYRVKLADNTFFSGTFIVASATSVRIFTLRSWTKGAATGGEARKYVPIYPIISGANESPIEATIRKVGRPSGGFRGRASKRQR